MRHPAEYRRMPQQVSYVAQFSWPFGPSLTLAVMAKSTSDNRCRIFEMSDNVECIAQLSC
jgi:NADH pyrophosphatase NudC (nudix superfamily)